MPSSLPRRTFIAGLLRKMSSKIIFCLWDWTPTTGLPKWRWKIRRWRNDESAWSNGSAGSSNGHRVRANARPGPADDESGSVLPTTHAARNYRELTAYQFTLEEQNLPEYVFRQK